MTIPLIDLRTQYRSLKIKIQARMDAVLEHGQYIMGPEVVQLEKELASYTGAKHCITVASGTEALLISLMALGIGPGDEVITTPFSFAATAEVIVLLGATPIFVDIEYDTCNIDVNLIEEKLSVRTKAIIPVSLYGQVANISEINSLAMNHGEIPVIEDAAQSFGATYRGVKSCNLSTIGCTSFFPSKPLGCYGDGGAIFTNNDILAMAMREIRVHGQRERYHHTRIGVGGRMDTLQCAILLAKLDRFEWELTQRKLVAERYHRMFDAIGISRIRQRRDRESVFAQYTIMVRDRDNLKTRLAEHGITTAIHYSRPINEQPAYSEFCCVGCTPIASQIAGEVLSLPMGPDLTEEDQLQILRAISK